MSRPKLPDSKKQISARVDSAIKRAIVKLAAQGKHTESQAIAILLAESPRIKAELRGAR